MSPKGAKPKFKKVTHAIFDMDGLLLDTEKIYDKVLTDLIASMGKKHTMELRMKILGCPELVGCTHIVKDLGLPMTPEEFCEKYQSIAFTKIGDCELMPGAERLVRYFSRSNIPIAVATSSQMEAVAVKTSRHQEIMKLFHHLVSAASDPEVKHGKPKPDVFQVCAKRFPDKPKPANVLVFEDSPNGITAAVAAGMQNIIVPDKLTDPTKYTHAMLVLNSLQDFEPELFGLPPI